MEFTFIGLYLLFLAAGSVVAYYAIPNILVRALSVDYRGKKVQGRFAKPDPNHALMVTLGGIKRRVLVGVNYRLYRGDPSKQPEEQSESFDRPIQLDGHEGLWIVPREPHEPVEIGGNLDPIVWVLDAWVYAVTGYRVIGATLADLFGAELASYNLARPDYMRNSTPAGADDISYYVDLNKQVVEYRVRKADTGGIEAIELDGKKIEYRSAIEADLDGQVTIVIANLDKVWFGVNKYFAYLLQIVESAIVEAVRGSNADLLRNKAWVKANIDPAPLLKNGMVYSGLAERYTKLLEIRPEKDPEPGDEEARKFRSDWDKARSLPGTFEGLGFLVTSSKNGAIEFDQAFKDFLAEQQQQLRISATRVQKAGAEVQIAKLDKQADQERALGKAAYTLEELKASRVGAEELMLILGDPTLVTHVLNTQQQAAAAKNATGGATIFFGGGQIPMPTPVLEVGKKPPSKTTPSQEKKAEE